MEEFRMKTNTLERMDRRPGAVILIVLLSVMTAMPPAAGELLDICESCHANATCDDKLDGPGKTCNCMYGFVGNGRTVCLDKDECQLGSRDICGPHTSCHNTFGSYFCTCLHGYSPSNSLATFTPNDGTHCQDVDECQVIPGVCGQGARCVNLDRGFECRCLLGYRVHNATEPFHPLRDHGSCKVVDCGRPPTVDDTVVLSTTGTQYGGVVLWGCREGFVWRRGDNSSTCGADGAWSEPGLLCEGSLEVDCGSPPTPPHSHMLQWDKTASLGSQALYRCNPGYHNVGGAAVSVCTPRRRWEVSMLCQEITCGPPPVVRSTERVWNGDRTPGSTVLYTCMEGFYNTGGNGLLHCNNTGHWTKPTLSCQEISCGSPPVLPHTGRVWNGSSSPGTVVFYSCKTGFCEDKMDFNNSHDVANMSVCTIHGYWTRPNLLCKAVDCGAPPKPPHAFISWGNGSTPGSSVVYGCDPGYRHMGEGNTSVCSASGLWSPPGLLCQEIQCGEPLFKPHAKVLWDKASHIGSVLYYQCEEGYHASAATNSSVCGDNGRWEESDLQCEVVDCGAPANPPHAFISWGNGSMLGSSVVYGCDPGYRHVGEGNTSVCSASGLWSPPGLLCQEIQCGEPLFKPHAKVLWDKASHIGSVLYYQCEEGYHTSAATNSSVCGDNGRWEESDLQCEELQCGAPLTLPHTRLLWDGRSAAGSVALYACAEGYYEDGGQQRAISKCSQTGEWGNVSLNCKARCGLAPSMARAELVWYNASMSLHRCVDGYHSWRGSSVSVCGGTGEWQKATLKCIEVKPAINDLHVFNEKCVRWRAEKYEHDKEIYKVVYRGVREYQGSFRHEGKQLLSSEGERVDVCLSLLPATNYTVSITALSARFTASVTTNTSLQVPQAPVILYREFDTPMATLRLQHSAHTLDAISVYQVFVVPLDGMVVFDCASRGSPDFLSAGAGPSSGQYVTGQFPIRHMRGKEMNFTLGDGRYHGGFFNAPLTRGRNYYVILRVVSRWKEAFKSSCVLWAKITGTSYVMKMSSLWAAGSVGVLTVVVLLGYSYTWFFKRM